MAFHPAFGRKLPRNHLFRTRPAGPTSGDVQGIATSRPRLLRDTYRCHNCGSEVPKTSFVCKECGRDVS
jgi:predicted RNA-binding Zn-ribbon protein involved in translation (DUF1610 family)